MDEHKKQKGLNIIPALAKRAGILVENMSLGSMRKFGLSYEYMRKINPKIIYCSVSSFM